MSSNAQKRFIELDLLRTFAIFAMIIYHTAYDLQMFYGWDIDIFSGEWKLFQIAIAALFLLLVGVTAAVSDHRITTRAPRVRGAPTPWHRMMRRFLKIGAAALLVSIVTYVIDPHTYVRFGILHLIAVSALLLPLITWLCRRPAGASLRVPVVMIILGMGIIALEPITTQWSAQWAQNFAPLLVPLGITGSGFTTVDYFPIIPWFGVILIGHAVGYLYYVRHADRHRVMQIADLRLIAWCGRHSLLLYLIHQPIILGILWLTFGKPQL